MRKLLAALHLCVTVLCVLVAATLAHSCNKECDYCAESAPAPTIDDCDYFMRQALQNVNYSNNAVQAWAQLAQACFLRKLCIASGACT